MKKNICIALTFFGLFLSYSACFSQEAERRLYWVPGLNERNVFWQRYFERFPITHRVRQDQSQNTDHLSNQNITNLSNFVGAPLNGYNNDPVLQQPIGIGHSMGGLMARDIDRQWIGPAKKFCSIVTVGTPNQGAFAVNAAQSGMVEQAYLRATRAVALGPAYDAVSGAVGYIFNGDYTAGVVSGITMMFAGKEVVGFIGKSIWDANFGGFIQNINTPPASEMAVGSNRMSQFGAPNVPAISIWGNEDGPMIYRMATVAERTADIPNNPLDYSTDSKYVNWATTLASSYQGAKYAHGIYSIFGGIWGIFTLNPTEVALAAYHASAVVAYDEGRSYLLWDAENDYRRIISRYVGGNN